MYKHVKYKGAWYVMHTEQHIEFMNIPRDSTNPIVDPYKFSVAMLTRRKKRIYVALITGSNYEFDIGIKREWIAFVEAINEGMKLFQEDIDRQKEIKDFKKRNKK